MKRISESERSSGSFSYEKGRFNFSLRDHEVRNSTGVQVGLRTAHRCQHFRVIIERVERTRTCHGTTIVTELCMGTLIVHSSCAAKSPVGVAASSRANIIVSVVVTCCRQQARPKRWALPSARVRPLPMPKGASP